MITKRATDFYFEDTVIDFYRESNEVEEFFNTFQNHIFPYIKEEHINWLDVGIGNGEKMLKVLGLFDTKPNITYLEPSVRWVKELVKSGNLDNLKTCSYIKGFQQTFEKFTNSDHPFEFDLISFVQVLYEPRLVDALFEFIDTKKNKKPYKLIINLENEKNDLYKIRMQLASNDIRVPHSQLDNIEEKLKKRNLKYTKHNSENKRLTISATDIAQSTNHWFYSFILGCEKKQFNELDEHEKKRIAQFILFSIRQTATIDINDTTFCALII